MAGYSETPLFKKLGIKTGYSLYVRNAPSDYKELIAPLPEDVKLVARLTNDLDLIHFFTKSRNELASHIESFMKYIKSDGMIWISWPKKSSKLDTDLTEDGIREIILPLGLVDIKVCTVDEVWSGLKVVIRKSIR